MSPTIKNSPGLHFLFWKFGLTPANTQTTPAEQECLLEHATGKKRLLEIGVWHGINSKKFREVMHEDGTLYANDPFFPGKFGMQWQKYVAHGEIKKCSRGNVQFLEMISEEASKEIDKHESEEQFLDFVFIDGDHSYEGVKTDWNCWTPRIIPGGIVALHDSRSHEGRSIDNAGSARFTREVVVNDDRFEIVNEVDSLTVLRRK